MNVLFGYIPTEVLTLYVAILAAIGSAKPKPGSVSPAFWITFWVFLALYSWYSTGLAGVAVLVASTVLGLLAPFFQRPLGT
jgi:TctA family transporter